jgi:O-antigen/teichoic acid export membrane protein
MLMVVLNMIFIPLYGIEGAAFATLLTIIFYNTVKLFYVIVKLNLNPFTIKTVHSFALLIACFLLFYFWDFHFHPIINILLKSGLITVFYLFFNYKLKISQDFNRVVLSILKRFKMA